MPDEPTTPAARIAGRSRRMRTAGIAGALAILAAFSGLAAGRMTGGDHAATPSATVSPATPSAAPDASSGAS